MFYLRGYSPPVSKYKSLRPCLLHRHILHAINVNSLVFCCRSESEMDIWKCKYCPFNCAKRTKLFNHYRLKHGSFSRTEPLPCLYEDCLCTFRSFNALKVHLSRLHNKPDIQPSHADVPVKKQMDVTFAFRRKEIVHKKPDVSEVLARWPALFTESQASCEYSQNRALWPCVLCMG